MREQNHNTSQTSGEDLRVNILILIQTFNVGSALDWKWTSAFPPIVFVFIRRKILDTPTTIKCYSIIEKVFDTSVFYTYFNTYYPTHNFLAAIT